MKSSAVTKKDRRLVLSILIAVLLFAFSLTLMGCAGNSSQQSNANSSEQNNADSFQHKTARDIYEIEEYFDKAQQKIADEEAPDIEDEEERTELMYDLADDFNEANEHYRNGEYEAAQEGYEQVIAQYSNHFGANNNLTLALLKQEKNDEALEQAILTCLRDDGENEALINLQVAMVACGFATSDLSKCSFVVSPDSTEFFVSYERSMTLTGQEQFAYVYNDLWDSIEINLDESTSDNESDMEDEYYRIRNSLVDNVDSSDPDWQELADYNDACAYALGIIDKTEYEDLQSSSK